TELDGVLAFLGCERLVQQQRWHDAEVMDDRRARCRDVFPPPGCAEPLRHDQAVRSQYHACGGEGLAVHVVERQRIQDALAPVRDAHEATDVAVPAARGQVVEI